MAWKLCLLLLASAALTAAQPRRDEIADAAKASFEPDDPSERGNLDAYVRDFEWEAYDGWYNNPAHPDWGGADMPLERKTPIAYPDGVYEFGGKNRPNVILIANASQNGLTGFPSQTRTALFTFFGQQVVEEMLDAQRPGCVIEYEDMLIPKCHPLFDRDCRGDRYIPFLRNRYDFRTGYSPNVPRMQLNEITPWLDGGLMYGFTKTWADTLRSFEGGNLAAMARDGSESTLENPIPIAEQVPIPNTIGLPMANPPPPANATLEPVNRFWRIGNPRGNENPFLLTMGILWFRVHNWWAEQLRNYGEENGLRENWVDDEWLFNRARQLTIATYQHIVYSEWLPQFIPEKMAEVNRIIALAQELPPPDPDAMPTLPEYAYTPGYSLYFGRTGYNPGINPQVAHIFQSAAMRFGHTIVTPGIWRRQLTGSENDCRFGSPIAPEYDGTNSFLKNIGDTIEPITRWRDVTRQFYDPFVSGSNNISDAPEGVQVINSIISNTINPGVTTDSAYSTDADDDHFVVRTCNSFWNPTVTINQTNVDPFYLGMSSQATEREDTIITPDLRGRVFGGFDFTRRDLMAVNMQRARDHGLPDFNSARLAYGLPAVRNFEDLNPLYGLHEEVTRGIENLRDVYNNDISLCDIWACGMAETIPSDNVRNIPSGPGTLFQEVLYDQFMRIRHGDRFWYENYKSNGILTEKEFEFINSLTMKQLLLLITNINNTEMSDTPFLFDSNTVCPQPYQLSELYMDDCIGLHTFDYYYSESVWQVPFIWGLVFLYIAIVILILFIIAEYNKFRRRQILNAGRTSSARKIEGTDVTNPEGEILVATELKAGLKCESRDVSMKFGPGKRLVLFFGNTVLREVDLRYQVSVSIQRPINDRMIFAVKIPHEYDIVIRCHNPVDRSIFIDKLEQFLDDIRIGKTLEEPTKRDLLNGVFTKKDRQRLLENFFKSVFQEGAQTGAGTIGETRRDILDCELTRAEFADAMSMKKDSLFVDQMFELIDKDGNGFVSFREFLDMIVIFAKGSPDDKIELMFTMYDVDKSGHLDRVEFKRMLKSMMELVNASVTADQMDQLVDSMFTAAGIQQKEELTLEDFKLLLRDHKDELSDARLKVAQAPDVEIKVAPDQAPDQARGEDEPVPSRYRSRETAPARARRTIIKAYSKQPSSQSTAKESEASPTFTEIPIVMRRNYAKSKLGRYFAAFIRYIENYKLHIFWLSLYTLVTILIFVERAYYYSVEREFAGLRRIAGYGVTITRGAASGMMWTYSILLLTMCRNFITYLRETIFNYYVPLDSYITFHKIIALTGLAYTVCHCIGHGINFYHIATQTANDLSCIFTNVYHRTHFLPKFTYWLFLTMTGFTAWVLTLVTIVIFVFAVQYARRHTFQAFWFTHHWYVIFYILTFLHGSGRLVQDPLFGNFFLGPGVVFAIDQIISVSRRKIEVSVVRADILPSQVIGIYFKRPNTFDYKAGQWMRIASVAQNPGEYHPFTISSAPHEELLSLHIRAVGPWTYNFRENYNPANLHGRPFPKVLVDGPFGEGHQDWFRYEVSILVGGGIGVTPFASILKELVHRFNIGARIECKKVFFIWVTRTQKQWEWFIDTIREVEEADKKGIVENHIFITQFFDKFDLRTTMLYICERNFQKISGRSLFTGLRSVTHFGRPDFNSFFDNLQEEYLLLPKIGVFSCGPPGMTNGVEAACAATNRFEGPAFIHHFENF